MKKIAVVLAGCGVYDGAEINEVVLTLLHILKNGASYQCFAPDREQMHVINHLSGEPVEESRNVLVESARIVRGEVKALEECDAEHFDALIVPGGFGAAKNLCDFAVNGANANIQDDIKTLLEQFKGLSKPIGYMCIAPALIPFVHDKGTKATIGQDVETAKALESNGLHHENCEVSDIVVDEAAKVVTTPAYMLAENILQAEEGISKLVSKVISLS